MNDANDPHGHIPEWLQRNIDVDAEDVVASFGELSISAVRDLSRATYSGDPRSCADLVLKGRPLPDGVTPSDVVQAMGDALVAARDDWLAPFDQ
jgi:hypothetical protein